jgi:deazaflavin-dependent oxidoreductase (nitroreductase family)
VNYGLVNVVVNPVVRRILRSPFRFLLPKCWALVTYTGWRTHKKRSLPVRVAEYGDEFVVVPGCFGELPGWWRNLRKESMVHVLYRGKSRECFAKVIEGDEAIAAPRIAAYVGRFDSGLLGITAETTEETFNELVAEAAKTYPIVAIRPGLSENREN